MATTDAKAGFRLPWSSDRQSSETADDGSTDPNAEATGWPSEDNLSLVESAAPPAAADTGGSLADSLAASTPTASAPAPKPARKPSKFMADLTKAMQAAAEDARARALSQLQADAKAHVETIHGRSSTDAAVLRRRADDDVAAVREWSKAEIARIREETETRITARKANLEAEIENHAAVIEREIDAVQKTVSSFETEMAAFFERLLVEEDPSRFATMAENLPEPPTFDASATLIEGEDDTGTATETVDEPELGSTDVTADTQDVTDALASEVDAAGPRPDAPAGELDHEAAMAAIQAAAEAAASATAAADAAARAEAVADVAIEIMGNHEDAETEADPRFAALGLSPDFDAAEAEAFADADGSDEDIPEIGDDTLAARLAGLVPAKGADTESATTQVVVVGLVSVASIASFKRHLGRVAGVQSVGVSSGPEGEFIFAVSHGADVVVREAIPSLPTFQARVTGTADGVVHVTAHDPESDA